MVFALKILDEGEFEGRVIFRQDVMDPLWAFAGDHKALTGEDLPVNPDTGKALINPRVYENLTVFAEVENEEYEGTMQVRVVKLHRDEDAQAF